MRGGKVGRTWAKRYETAEEVMEAFATPVPESGCWIWTAHTSNGYGRVNHAGKQRYAHRVVFELANGPIPPGMYVCHHCDVRECVNPKHMFLGTHLDNIADCVAKGRHAKGVRSHWAQLTDEQVRAIRADRGIMLQAETAREFGVSVSTVSLIQLGRIWRHVQ